MALVIFAVAAVCFTLGILYGGSYLSRWARLWAASRWRTIVSHLSTAGHPVNGTITLVVCPHVPVHVYSVQLTPSACGGIVTSLQIACEEQLAVPTPGSVFVGQPRRFSLPVLLPSQRLELNFEGDTEGELLVMAVQTRHAERASFWERVRWCLKREED